MSDDKPARERGLYEGLGLVDSERTRRPQKKALAEACKPVSRADFDALKRRVAELEKLVHTDT